MKRQLLAWATVAALTWSPLAGAQVPPAELDARLSELVRQAYEQPEQALQQLRALADRPQSRAESRHLLFIEGRIAVQSGDLSRVFSIADTLSQDPQYLDRAELLRAEAADRQGQTTRAGELAERALLGMRRFCPPKDELAHSIPAQCDFRSSWAALRVLMLKQSADGALADAEVSAQHALKLAQLGHDAAMRSVSLMTLAHLSKEQGLAAQADKLLAQAMAAAQGHPDLIARVKVFEATLMNQHLDISAQRSLLEEALAICDSAGSERLAANIRTNLGDVYLRLSQSDAALRVLQQVLPVVQRFKDVHTERTARHNLAMVYIRQRQFDKARQELLRVNEIRQGQADQGLRINELRETGEAWAAAGQPREALQAYHEERRLTEEVHARQQQAALQQQELRFDSQRKQKELEVLQHEQALKDRQLGNQSLAKQVGAAVVLLTVLAITLMAVMVRRVRRAHRQLRDNEQQLRVQSERDPLTDLANRRHFLGVMAQLEGSDFEGALLMVDIDHFKNVNDQHGHAAGDVVICEVARRLSQAVRSEDLVVRWGGEEFLIFAPGMLAEQVPDLAERVLQSIGDAPIKVDSGLLRVTASIGFAHFPLRPTDLALHWEQAVNWVDMALYTAKAQGRNRAVGINAVRASDTDSLLEIEANFDAACNNERVKLSVVHGPPAAKLA